MFTYDLDTDVGRLRLRVGDTREGSGALPDNSNFTDEELLSLITQYGLNGATVVTLEALATVWTRMVDTQVGPIRENWSDVARGYRMRAAEARDTYGGGSGTFSVGFLRDDSYSQAAEEAET